MTNNTEWPGASVSIDRQGPLSDLRIVEFAGQGPVPFCGIILADLGADIVRVGRPSAGDEDPYSIELRGRHNIGLDLKNPTDVETALSLIEQADAVMEGFRPGVMERLGLGSDRLFARRSNLVYARMTGWGQSGPWSGRAGHDINYIGLSGALHAIGLADRPAIPLNLIGDYGGGSLYLALGLIAGIMHARRTGEGQVVDCAMVDGVNHLLSPIRYERDIGHWYDRRQANILDGGAPFYNVYQCLNGSWIAVGAIEPQFFKVLIEIMGVDLKYVDAQNDQSRWPAMEAEFASTFKMRTREEWISLFEGTDACVTPVLSLEEAEKHPHNVAREAFKLHDGRQIAVPAPRFSKTPGRIRLPLTKS